MTLKPVVRKDAQGVSGTHCKFRTADKIKILPMLVRQASYADSLYDQSIPASIKDKIKGVVNISLESTAGLTFNQISTTSLRFYVNAGLRSQALHALILGSAESVQVVSVDAGKEKQIAWLPASCLQPVGFESEEALLPIPDIAFNGYRLLQEYFACPERFLFFDVILADQILERCVGSILELRILLGREENFEDQISAESFVLHCAPAINLFPVANSTVNVSLGEDEYEIRAEGNEQDYELFSVDTVRGYHLGGGGIQGFAPMYKLNKGAVGSNEASFALRRESADAVSQSNSSRRRYAPSRAYLSLVDSNERPYSRNLVRLLVDGEWTNGDLPLNLLPKTEIVSEKYKCRVLAQPTPPISPLSLRNSMWALIQHLFLNHFPWPLASARNESSDGSHSRDAALALKSMLRLYANAQNNDVVRKQIDGIATLSFEPAVHRTAQFREMTYVRKVAVTIDVDEQAFPGRSPYLFGLVMAHFFRRTASINTLVSTRVKTLGGNEVGQWEPLWGSRSSH